MDCSVIPLRNDEFLISTTDFFYPLIDDPYLQGKIGCANVLSDLYAMGISKCDNMLMILASSRLMPERERNIVTQQLIRGFNDLANQGETQVTGGQTVLNPWPIIGGTAISVCKADEFIRPDKLQVGDVLVLTKPLGTQVIVNANQWYNTKDAKWETASAVLSVEKLKEALGKAIESMTRLNRNGARLMLKYGAHGATDVTGFGLIGHAANLAQNQAGKMNIEIHSLPIISPFHEVAPLFPFFKLLQGFSAETSGGLLVALPENVAQQFIDELVALDGQPAWIIGKVVENTTSENNTAYIIDNFNVIEV